MEHTGFPSDETLAAFLDGSLDPETRRRVIEHMATCDECYSVVAASGEGDSIRPLLAEAPERAHYHWKRAVAPLAAAALIALAAILIAPLRQRLIPRETPRTALQLVADAAGPERRLDGRLTGVQYAPRERATRGDDPNNALAYAGLSAISGSIAREATEHPTNESLHAVGLSLLLLGKTDQGIDALEKLLHRETHESDITAAIQKCNDSGLLSDLSAAYCDRGRQSEKGGLDFVRADDAAERACSLDPRSREAAWNRAIAVEQFHVREQVDAAWRAYLALDDISDWAREASQRRTAARTKTSESDQWPETAHLIEQAADNGDSEVIDRQIDAHNESARVMLSRTFADWAHASLNGDSVKAASARRLAIAIGSSLSRAAGGDAFDRDMVKAISDAPFANMYGRYFDASAQAAAGKCEAAQPVIEKLLPDLDRARAPILLLAQTDLSVCALYREDYQQAAAMADEVATAAAKDKYWHVAGRARGYQGLALARSGRPYDAVAAYVAGVDAYERARESGNVATALAFLAEVELTVGREEESWSHRFASFQLLDAVRDHSWRDGMLVNAALAAKAGGHRALAIRLLSGAIDGERRATEVGSMHDALVSRGELLYTLDQASAASADFTQAAALRSQMTELKRIRATTFANGIEAAAIEQRHPLRALTLFNRTIAEAERVGLRYALPELHYGRATALQRVGAPISEVVRDLQTSVSLLEEQFRGGALADRAEATSEKIYRDTVYTLVQVGQSREALSYSDAYRSYALRDRTKRSATIGIEPGVVTLSFLFARDGLLVFVAKGSQVNVVNTSTSEEEVAALVDLVWSRDVPEQTRTNALGRLSTLLIKPVESYLESASTIGVVPDRVLHRVPFAALPTSEGTPLVLRAKVVRLRFAIPGASKTLADRERGSVLALGNPTIDQNEFGELPDLRQAEKEVRAVAAVYRESTVLLREAATRHAFMSRVPGASIVQISAHGVARSTDPLKAAILLSGGPSGGGGALYVRDILQLHLPSVQLVVLAGCETGSAAGTYAGASLADAFLAAGAQSVLATLADVEDGGAGEFVIAFHGRLARGEHVVDAFSDTQREFQARAGHDLTWAAFEMTVGHPPAG
jgi:CHAT domain-containing protein